MWPSLLEARAQRAAPAFPCRSDRDLRTRSASLVPLQHVVDRLAPANDAPAVAVDQHFGRRSGADCSSTPSPRRRRRCRGSASRSPTSTGGSCAIAAERVARLADRPDDVGADRRTGARVDRLDAVPRAVERRPQQIGHAGVDDDEPAGRPGCGFRSTTCGDAGRRPGRRSIGPARGRASGPVRSIARRTARA